MKGLSHTYTGIHSPQRGFPGASNSKEFGCSAGVPGLISGLGRSPGEGKATHFSILAWRIPWTEEPGGLQFWGLQNQTQLSHSYTHTHTHALLQIPLASRLPHKIQLSSMCYILYFNFLLLSRVQLFVTPWTVTYQAPPFMGFSRQEYWSGCHLFLQSHKLSMGSLAQCLLPT